MWLRQRLAINHIIYHISCVQGPSTISGYSEARHGKSNTPRADFRVVTDDMARSDSAKRVKSTQTLFTILDELRELEVAGVSQLATALEMPKSTVHVHLKTLEEEGYLVKDGDEYRFSFRFLELGGETRQRLNAFRAAHSQVDELSLETGEAAHLGVEEGGKRVLLYSSTLKDGLYDNSPIGYHTHIHWTAMGKALLAKLSDDRVDAIIDEHGLPQATEHTVTDRDRLFEELEGIRERGYAIESDEHRDGLTTISMATEPDGTDRGPAGIGISGPTHRIVEKNAENELVESIRNAVNVVNLELRYY